MQVKQIDIVCDAFEILRNLVTDYSEERFGLAIFGNLIQNRECYIFLEPYKKLTCKQLQTFDDLDLPEGDLPFALATLPFEFYSKIKDLKSNSAYAGDATIYLYKMLLHLKCDSASTLYIDQRIDNSLWQIDLQRYIKLTAQPVLNNQVPGSNILSFKSNLSEEDYLNQVKKIKELILEGELYQANLTFSLSGELPISAGQLFVELIQNSTAEFTAYLREQDEIVSASPELFFSLDRDKILCSPIKGSIARGTDQKLDQEQIQILLSSKKDLAELAMIVDLIRNDLGKISQISSVNVRQHARIETLHNIHHLVSDIEAVLLPNLKLSKLISALFPSGSITGAPKIASIKILSEIEQRERSIYTGSIMTLSRQKIVASVAIRTALIRKGEISFGVGSGITLNSDPVAEFKECLVKAESILQILRLLGHTINIEA